MQSGGHIAAVLLLAAPAAAVADPICADRPGRASATCTAPAGHWQLESAVADWTRDDGETTLILGATAIKYGLTDRAHVELGVVPVAIVPGRSGLGDTLLRYKHRVTADGAPVEVSLYPYVKLPTARRGIGNGKVEAGLAAPIGHAVGGTPLSITLGPEIDWLADADGHGHHAAMIQVANLGWSVTEQWKLSAELWGKWDWDPAGTTRQASADATIAYVPSDDLQLDGGVNFGLNRATANVQLYVGIAKRF